jgi:protein-S-isoprenylcysteine O-methyltransferase Ste14
MNVDDLLNQPLNSVADNGFSAGVMGRVRAVRRQKLFATWASAAACVVLAFLILPWQPVGAELGLVIPKIAGSLAVNFAAAVIALSLLLERQFARL